MHFLSLHDGGVTKIFLHIKVVMETLQPWACGITTTLATLVLANHAFVLIITINIIKIRSQKSIEFRVVHCNVIFIIYGLWGIGVKVVHSMIMFLVLSDSLIESMIENKVAYN